MPNLAQLLSSKSSAEYQRVFNVCREIARELETVEGVYVVGGVVRDLILGREPGDIDLSVVGDAKAFADALGSRLGTGAPIESQFLTYKLNTNKLRDAGSLAGISAIDIVNARSETYAGPAELPEVEPGSIIDDLKRRDFTINSMAISLNDSDWGLLIDPMNGFADTMRKRIKIHHDSSFVVDPTRIFRTVRYAARLEFTIESRSVELIAKSLPNIDRLSGARVRNEFELMLGEPKRVEILKRAEELGILAAISPGLRIGSRSLQVLESQQKEGRLSTELEDLIAITTFGLNDVEAAQVVERFDGPPAWGESITGNAALSKLVAVLDQEKLSPSEIVDILSPIPLASIRAYIAAGPPLPRRDRLNKYLNEFRYVRPDISGDDLLEVGIPEGPAIGRLIDVVRRARLDGKVASRQEEIALAKSRLPGFLTETS